jgi:hypothetical protein
MKTTLEVPDKLYRQVKVRAALQGQTIKSFFIDAIRTKLAAESGAKRSAKKAKNGETGWRAVFGAADPEEVAQAQRIIDEEFSRIDPEGWD